MSVEVFHSLKEARGHFGPCALAIGNFDGVHLGHQALIQEAVLFARTHSLVPAVLTFDPHPTAVLAPKRVPLLISSFEERLRLIAELGVQRIFVLRFTSEIARLLPEEFVSQILLSALRTKAIFVGDNFRFGHKQSGTPDLLRSLGTSWGFTSHFIAPVSLRGERVSSTAIRRDVTAAKVTAAGRLLGRCFSLEGQVVSGRGIGSTKAVPTLNLQPSADLLIPRGIYVSETLEQATGRRWNSVTSCGYNPTFGATDLTVETYLLTPFQGASPTDISVRFYHFLREERTYPDAESLKAQILKDVARAEAYWQHAGRFMKSVASIY